MAVVCMCGGSCMSMTDTVWGPAAGGGFSSTGDGTRGAEITAVGSAGGPCWKVSKLGRPSPLIQAPPPPPVMEAMASCGEGPIPVAAEE